MKIISQLSKYSDLLVPTPDDAYTVKYDNKFVHSRKNPIKEAYKLIQTLPQCDKDKTLIIAWGTGLGYHLELLIDQGYHVLAIELRSDIIDIFKNTFPTDKLVGFLTNSSPNEIFDFLVALDEKQFSYFIDLPMLGIVIPPSLYEQSIQAKKALKSLVNIRTALIDIWYYNIIQNISLTNRSNIGFTFDPIFDEQTLVVCSAGPSLKESLPYLKKNRNKFTLLAVDTAFLTLVQDDIIPDYIHSVDAKIHNIADFRGISSEILNQITLLADITLSNQIVRLPWKNILFVSTVHPIVKNKQTIFKRTCLQQYLWDHNIRFPENQTGGSVATSAFCLGLMYQAKKILLVGQDLAYSNNRGHSVGSSYDMEYRLQTNRLNSLETIHIHKIPFDECAFKSIDNKQTYADVLLNQFRSWFEVSVREYPNLYPKVINSSINGAYFQYWMHIPINQYNFELNIKRNTDVRHYSTEDLQTILNNILQLPIDIDQDNKISQEFFYKELSMHQKDINSIRKKTNLLIKKIKRALCLIR